MSEEQLEHNTEAGEAKKTTTRVLADHTASLFEAGRQAEKLLGKLSNEESLEITGYKKQYDQTLNSLQHQDLDSPEYEKLSSDASDLIAKSRNIIEGSIRVLKHLGIVAQKGERYTGKLTDDELNQLEDPASVIDSAQAIIDNYVQKDQKEARIVAAFTRVMGGVKKAIEDSQPENVQDKNSDVITRFENPPQSADQTIDEAKAAVAEVRKARMRDIRSKSRENAKRSISGYKDHLDLRQATQKTYVDQVEQEREIANTPDGLKR